jgi:hypothetical protein
MDRQIGQLLQLYYLADIFHFCSPCPPMRRAVPIHPEQESGNSDYAAKEVLNIIPVNTQKVSETFQNRCPNLFGFSTQFFFVYLSLF